jgi:hypothetical protein
VKKNCISNVDNIGIDIIGFEGDSKLQAKTGEIIENTIYDLRAGNGAYPNLAAIYIDGGTGTDFNTGKILIEKNIIYSFGYGIELGAENENEHPDVTTQYVVVQHNILFNNLVTGIGVGHEPDEKNKNKMKSYVWNCRIINNTFYGNGIVNYQSESSNGELHFGSFYENTVKKIEVIDNIVVAREKQHLVVAQGKNLSPDVSFSGNIFLAENTNALWAWKKKSFYYQQNQLFDSKGLSKFDTVGIKGNNNIWTDPQFVSQNPNKKEDFKLKEPSPAKGKGALIF